MIQEIKVAKERAKGKGKNNQKGLLNRQNSGGNNFGKGNNQHSNNGKGGNRSNNSKSKGKGSNSNPNNMPLQRSNSGHNQGQQSNLSTQQGLLQGLQGNQTNQQVPNGNQGSQGHQGSQSHQGKGKGRKGRQAALDLLNRVEQFHKQIEQEQNQTGLLQVAPSNQCINVGKQQLQQQLQQQQFAGGVLPQPQDPVQQIQQHAQQQVQQQQQQVLQQEQDNHMAAIELEEQALQRKMLALQERKKRVAENLNAFEYNNAHHTNVAGVPAHAQKVSSACHPSANTTKSATPSSTRTENSYSSKSQKF